MRYRLAIPAQLRLQDPGSDVVGAKLLGFNVQAVRHLWEAEKRELGETDTQKMEFPMMSLREAIAAFTEAASGERLTFERVLLRHGWLAILASHPYVNLAT